MSNDLLRKLLIDEEGQKNEAYKDHLGKWTIGIGHLLDQDQSDEEIEVLGLTGTGQVGLGSTWEGFTLSDDQVYALFEIDVQDAIDDIAAVFTPEALDDLGETRRAVVLSMVFQLGGAGFRKFKNFISAVKAGNYATAAGEMMNSLAARQTPERWERASAAMRDGYFEKYTDPKDGDDPEGSFRTVYSLSDFTINDLLDEIRRRIDND